MTLKVRLTPIETTLVGLQVLSVCLSEKPWLNHRSWNRLQTCLVILESYKYLQKAKQTFQESQISNFKDNMIILSQNLGKQISSVNFFKVRLRFSKSERKRKSSNSLANRLSKKKLERFGWELSKGRLNQETR